MKIDCDTCAAQGPACADCVVSFLLVSRGAPAVATRVPSVVEMDDDQVAAVRALSRGGLVPPLRHAAS